jgi:fructose-specific phosphotransferase system component IIB
VGSLAAGGAAVTGTGAFTSASAERTVSVETAGDANAYLSLTEGPNSAADDVFVENNGQIKLAFNGRNTDATGLNKDATTAFTNVVTVENQGTDGVEFGVDASNIRDLSAVDDFDVFAHDTPADESPEYDSENFAQVESSYPAAIRAPEAGGTNDHVNLAVGESVDLSFNIDTNDQSLDAEPNIYFVAVQKGGRYDLENGEAYP